MKTAVFAALSMISLFASAQEKPVVSPAETASEAPYDYSQDLDIAKVVRITTANNAANQCGPVTAHMEYVDSKGVSHKLQYTRLGGGCQSG
ncbi:MAG TPA: DUF2790 domain-containing protein [Pseudomonas sp.]|nr:DUF2790 domain-containing protein [Pseudomonas sp.]